MTVSEPSAPIGSRVHVLLESPIDGRAFVVVQGKQLYEAIPVDIRDGQATLELDVRPGWYPNVWIEATAVYAVDPGKRQVHPFSSTAVANLKVTDPARGLTVEFPDLPEEARPLEPVTITIATRDAYGLPVDAAVTLAAVDEGIHAITGYRTPDPFAWFGRTRRPDLNLAHYYDMVAQPWEAPAAGGDGAIGTEHLGRLGTRWIETVALWSGEVRTGADGLTSVTLQLPEFNGQLRLVAVASNARANGSTSERLYVRRPWMLQTSLPRFLLPGDTATVLGTVYNTTGTSGTVDLTLATSGTLTAIDPTTASRWITVGAPGEATERFRDHGGEIGRSGLTGLDREIARRAAIRSIRCI